MEAFSDGVIAILITIMVLELRVPKEATLAALLPLLPAKQRPTHPNDWMTTDSDIACPDVHCGAVFRILRTGTRTFRHSEESAEPLPGPGA